MRERRTDHGHADAHALEHAARDWRLDEIYLHIDMRNAPAAKLYAEYEALPQYDDVCSAGGLSEAQNRYHRRKLDVTKKDDDVACSRAEAEEECLEPNKEERVEAP